MALGLEYTASSQRLRLTREAFLLQWTARHDIALKRIRSVIKTNVVCNMRTLEQKIADAGPGHQRIDPHILTEVRKFMISNGELVSIAPEGIEWFYLPETDSDRLRKRLDVLLPIHKKTLRSGFTKRLGQTLEIATFRALKAQTSLHFFGSFLDLDDHDDSELYKKVEPPSSFSGRTLLKDRKLDFLISLGSVYAGIEIKNIREWIYPNRFEIREMLSKCCVLDVVPILIARRVHFTTFRVLTRCGVVIHQTYNQLYPNSASDLAEAASDKDLLGYHDIRVGNEPDDRLTHFIETILPTILPKAKLQFDDFKTILCDYSNQQVTYDKFAKEVASRTID